MERKNKIPEFEYREEVSENLEELRYNPYHDPTNGRFTNGRAENGNFSSSAIRFSGGGASKSLTNNKKSVKLDSKGNPYKRPQLTLPKKEYGKVMHEINTLYDTKYKGRTIAQHVSGNYVYRFEIHEFDEYNIFSKEKI